MAERISKEPVVDRSKYPGVGIFIDAQGYLCITKKFGGVKLSPEEKEKRKAANKEKNEKKKAERAIFRKRMNVAKVKARKNPSIANAESYEAAKKAYEEIMGRK